MQDSKGVKDSASSEPEFEETSFLDVMNGFANNAFDNGGRALEFYPSIESIQEARTLIQLSEKSGGQ